MLTARDDEIDCVLGLEIGADDYLVKPFSMRELLARVKAQFRRARLLKDELHPPQNQTIPTLIFDDLRMDLHRGEAFLNNKPLLMKPLEYNLLQYLLEHQGQVLSRDHLLEQVWGWDYSGGSRTVDVHIRWLREKIEPDPSKPIRIVTVRGNGLSF